MGKTCSSQKAKGKHSFLVPKKKGGSIFVVKNIQEYSETLKNIQQYSRIFRNIQGYKDIPKYP